MKKPTIPAPNFTDPDLVDRIFEYLLEQCPQIRNTPPAQLEKTKLAVRHEFGGVREYLQSKESIERKERVKLVLSMFNGRNATEIARRLQISRATVYRKIKQAGR